MSDLNLNETIELICQLQEKRTAIIERYNQQMNEISNQISDLQKAADKLREKVAYKLRAKESRR